MENVSPEAILLPQITLLIFHKAIIKEEINITLKLLKKIRKCGGGVMVNYKQRYKKYYYHRQH